MFVASRYATKIWLGSNVCRFSICDSQVIEFKFYPIPKGMGFLFSEVHIHMNTRHFYFINEQYFIDFPDPYLMQNKETVNGQTHNRPCVIPAKTTSPRIDVKYISRHARGTSSSSISRSGSPIKGFLYIFPK